MTVKGNGRRPGVRGVSSLRLLVGGQTHVPCIVLNIQYILWRTHIGCATCEEGWQKTTTIRTLRHQIRPRYSPRQDCVKPRRDSGDDLAGLFGNRKRAIEIDAVQGLGRYYSTYPTCLGTLSPALTGIDAGTPVGEVRGAGNYPSVTSKMTGSNRPQGLLLHRHHCSW